jgi:hypothetical protein
MYKRCLELLGKSGVQSVFVEGLSSEGFESETLRLE